MSFFVQRVFGKARVGDDNWVRKCAEQEVDPHGVFEAENLGENEFRVRVGTSRYASNLTMKTFKIVNTLANKKLGDYL